MTAATNHQQIHSGNGSFGLNILVVAIVIISLLLLYQSMSQEKAIDPDNLETPKATQSTKSEPLTRVVVLPDPTPPEPRRVINKPARNAAKETSEAHTPAVDASFSMPVLDYVEALQRRANAKLVLFDPSRQRIMGQIKSGAFHAGNIDTKGMSMRTRNITRDLPASFRKQILKQAGENREVRFLIMLPADAEQRFENTLKQALSATGIAWQSMDQVDIRYRQSGGNIVADIRQIKTDGKIVRIGKSTPIW